MHKINKLLFEKQKYIIVIITHLRINREDNCRRDSEGFRLSLGYDAWEVEFFGNINVS